MMAKKVLQYAFMLVVGLWVLYQMRHSYYVRKGYQYDPMLEIMEFIKEEESSVRLLGRKGDIGSSDSAGDTELYGMDLIVAADEIKHVRPDVDDASGDGISVVKGEPVLNCGNDKRYKSMGENEENESTVMSDTDAVMVSDKVNDADVEDKGSEGSEVEATERWGAVVNHKREESVDDDNTFGDSNVDEKDELRAAGETLRSEGDIALKATNEKVDNEADVMMDDGDGQSTSEESNETENENREREGTEVEETLDEGDVIREKSAVSSDFRFSDENGVPEDDSSSTEETDNKVGRLVEGNGSRSSNKCRGIEACEGLHLQETDETHSSSKFQHTTVLKEVTKKDSVQSGKGSTLKISVKEF